MPSFLSLTRVIEIFHDMDIGKKTYVVSCRGLFTAAIYPCKDKKDNSLINTVCIAVKLLEDVLSSVRFDI